MIIEKITAEDIAQCDGVEISPVIEWVSQHGKVCEVISPDDFGLDPAAEYFWSVYLHLREGGVTCVADFETEAQATAYGDFLETMIA